jgi:chaperonin GroES
MMDKQSNRQQNMLTEQTLDMSQVPLRCANCEIEFLWPPTVVQSITYCCVGCATGGPCCCDYSQYHSVKISGVIHYGPGPDPEVPSNSIASQIQRGKEIYTVAAAIHPIGERVVVKPAAKEEVTKSGIVIPDTAKEKPQEGTVIAVGSGRLLDNGDRAPVEVKVGDRVLFAKYGGTEFKLDGEEYLVLKENDILAVIG